MQPAQDARSSGVGRGPDGSFSIDGLSSDKAIPKIAEWLEKKGIDVNKKLIIAGALLHDIERAKDNHIARGVSLLKKLGFPEVAEVIKRHSLYKIENEEVQPHTFEEKIVFYADKRVIGNKVASLKERFDDITKRYNVSLDNEYKFAKKIEAELN